MQPRPWEVGENHGDATPVNILGNLYFVGTQPASTHIIDTGEGLILLDSGYRETLHLVLGHMEALGLNPADIRYLVHTHGHIDHVGATAELKRLTGAKTFLGRADREIANGTLPLSYAAEYGMALEPFEADVLLEDGDEITLGSTTLRCVGTPGHTPGCLTFVFQVRDGDRTYTAALHGGMGVNTMSREFLEKYNLSYDCREQFLAAMDRLAEIPVDIFLGNHMQHNDTSGKTRRVLAGDRLAFVNPDEWRPHVLWCKENLLNMIRQEEQL